MSKIAAEELKTKLEAGEPVELVDIRETGEFEGWHIPGSRNLPVYDDLKANREDTLVHRSNGLPKDRPIVTVCRGGVLSERAAKVLGSLGYEASSLEGGMRGWGAVSTAVPLDPGSRADVTAIQVRRNGKGCLSYLLGADDRGLVIDPSVDAATYLDAARSRGMQITHVAETHVHADHLSRARELCRSTGAELVMPENRRVAYDYTPVRNGDKLILGGVAVEVICTPGHTSESACYLVEEDLLFTGDTLFVNAVGRPDLEKGDAGAEAGAHELFRSLHERLLRRFDDIRFYPCHHGEPIGFDASPIGSTLRAVRRQLALIQADESEFVRRILDSLSAKPPNHESIISINEGKSELEQLSALELEAGPNSCAAG